MQLFNTSIKPTNNESNETPLLTLVVDPGTTLIKAVYRQGERGKPEYLTESPLVRIVDAPTKQGTYVKLPNENEYCLIGDDAFIFPSKVTLSTKNCKSEYLVYRVLAVVGKIAQKLSLPTKFRVKITTLVSLTGMSFCKKYIENDLIEAFKLFEYKGKTYSVDCESCDFSREGQGVHEYIEVRHNCGYSIPEASACIVFGYRTISLLLFNNNQFDYDNSCIARIGFYDYLDKVACEGFDLERGELNRAIFTQKSTPNSRDERDEISGFTSQIDIESLIRSKKPSWAEKERNSIEEAIELANKEYWQTVEGWLNEYLPFINGLDRVTYCGGATPFFQTQIEGFFKNRNVTLFNTNEMAYLMMDKLAIPQDEQERFIEQSLPLRLADAWGEFVSLAGVEI